MTTLEIKKREFLKAIDSEETLNKLQKYLIRIKKRNIPPCQYTSNDVLAIIEKGEIEMEQGGGFSVEEIRNLYPRV
jgi:hypothetical protein